VAPHVNSPVHRHSSDRRIGVLLVNTGTPEAPTAAAVRRFLAEMLSDPRLVELPRSVWLPILHGVVLPLRPRRSAHAYQKIWTPQGSPQLVILQQLATELREALAAVHAELAGVEIGMCYGQPSVAGALGALRDSGAQRLIVLPLFPQYASVTTASAFDRVAEELRRWRSMPEIRFINEYHATPDYIAALRASVLEHWRSHGRAEHLLMTFHSQPARCLERGDPYHSQCHNTARLLAQALGLGEREWSLSFQSRFGFERWLEPYTDELVRRLAAGGLRRLDTICPGFAVDCLESLEEIAIRARETFIAAGGESLRYIPALNDRAEHVDCLATLIASHAGAARTETSGAVRATA
jgi:ferrochelatase